MCPNVFEIPYGFKLILKIVRRTTSGSDGFFMKFLQIADQNDPNNTPLERYRRGATFLYILLFLIRYGLRVVSNSLNRGILFFKFVHIFGTVFALVF